MNDRSMNADTGGVQRTVADAATLGRVDGGLRDSTGPYSPVSRTPADERTEVADLAVGTLVGKYQIVEAIRGGGMGFVFRAVNPDLKCDVALKVIRAGAIADADDVRRFALECEALARFRHPHIVAVYDAGQYRGRPYLVMEYIGGGCLAQCGTRFRDTPRDAVALMEKVARAVQQLHADGVLHRDLKPGNVLLDEAGEPRVCDFGLVKLLDGSGGDLTQTGHRPGTPSYMAPEQTDCVQSPVGPPTDVWALGVMLYELLLGRRPFIGADRSALFQRIARADPDRPRAVQKGFDPALEAVLLKCLEKDPAQRFATAGELADELARWLNREPTRTQPAGRLDWVGRAARRYPGTLALAVVALLAVVGVAAALILRDPERPLRRELRAGQPVVLVPERGEPTFSEAVVGTPVTSLTDDGYFSVQAWDPVLLALLRAPPCDEYRLRAKFRHYRGDNRGRVGIFVGYRKSPSPHGHFHLYYSLTYTDRADAKAITGGIPPANLTSVNPARFETQFLADLAKPPPRYGADELGSVRFDADPGGKTWRTLEIVVRPDELHASFDGMALKPVALRSMEKMTQVLLDGCAKADPIGEGFLAAVDPHFDGRGAVGLYLLGSCAAFSEVVIEPLTPP
jgi:serine/threonine-protein kinase